jgi:hypothetical protein
VTAKSWRASLIRSETQVLGDVQAATRQAVELAAIKQFELDAEQSKRLVVQERG